MQLRFGTDGVRGVANLDLTPEYAMALGRAVGQVLEPKVVLIGRDTRKSGPMLEAALAAGLAAQGVDVVDVGVIPTPGVAFLAEQRSIPGLVVSASHNPFYDNGIKLFTETGQKASPELEHLLEERVDGILRNQNRPPQSDPPSSIDHDGTEQREDPAISTHRSQSAPLPQQEFSEIYGLRIGSITIDRSSRQEYIDHLVQVAEGCSLKGMSIVLDCANGAASTVAPEVLSLLGATVHTINCEPDGVNINANCGSTHPSKLAHAVVQLQADLGLAFDGDADRLIAVDRNGRALDGDELIALFAIDLQEKGVLANQAVAVTVMSNAGLSNALRKRGITTIQTEVGDRHVFQAMVEKELILGGEQSGHLVFRHLATTGDGILTGVLLTELLHRKGIGLNNLVGTTIQRLPQVLRSVAVADAQRLSEADRLWAEVAKLQAEIGSQGRILLRASGTEPLIRVMVEAPDPQQAERVVQYLCQVVERELGTALSG